MTDTEGNLPAPAAWAADVRDRSGAPAVIAWVRESFPALERLFANWGCPGRALRRDAVKALGGPAIEVVKHPEGVAGFAVVERRRVVERTLAWLGRCRRLARGWERAIASSEA